MWQKKYQTIRNWNWFFIILMVIFYKALKTTENYMKISQQTKLFDKDQLYITTIEGRHLDISHAANY